VIFAPSLGLLYVVSFSLKAGSEAGCMNAVVLSLIPSDLGDVVSPTGRRSFRRD